MKFIEIVDFDRQLVSVNADRVVSVRKPSGRVYDHGSVTLDTGKTIRFGQDGEADRILRELDTDLTKVWGT